MLIFLINNIINKSKTTGKKKEKFFYKLINNISIFIIFDSIFLLYVIDFDRFYITFEISVVAFLISGLFGILFIEEISLNFV